MAGVLLCGSGCVQGNPVRQIRRNKCASLAALSSDAGVHVQQSLVLGAQFVVV
jgi:hypothetical protein